MAVSDMGMAGGVLLVVVVVIALLCQWCLQKAQTEKKMTLGDALPMNRVKDTALASIEQPKNPAGAVDIKGLEVVLDKVVHLRMVKG